MGPEAAVYQITGVVKERVGAAPNFRAAQRYPARTTNRCTRVDRTMAQRLFR
jgi:hypothetical protein